MSPRNPQDVLSAVWQWENPLKCFLLIIIIVVWGYLLDTCGEQPDYIPEIQKLMSLGSFIMSISFSLLTRITFSHIFAYVQGFFLLSKQGIPFQAVICEESTPLRVLTACFIMLKQKHNSIHQIISYLGTLIIYIASIIIGAYAASKLATPYIFYETSINWVQAPTKGLNSSLYSAFTPENSFGQFNEIQFNALSNWNTMTGVDGNEIAFMPMAIAKTIKELEQNLTQNNQSNNQPSNNELTKWKLEKVFNNVGMQYLASQCSANIIPPCEIDGRESVHVMAGKENQTISWRLCNLHYNTINTSMQIDCNISIKGGVFPLITFEYPSANQQPREEDLSQVLMKKNELKELEEIKNNLFAIMENALLRPFNYSDPITKNVAMQLASAWSCEPENVTCAQSKGTAATVRYVGALLDTTSVMYLAEISKNITEFLKNNSSTTGSFRISHRVCLGGTNPMQSIGIMITIPLIIVIIGLLPLLYNNKLWWLAADIGNNYIAFARSISPCGENWDNELPECTARPGETKFKKTVRLNIKDNHIGLSSSLHDNKT
ncbi:2988_t:CDS:1 [Dentiscutata heterogama]|uniref:2988_t:CDS:1 n=1 Tax=Dentiscutata heterogama TaxID=1316150 RepID=A0ACA9MEE9_9GLOM|nr:2988_t:CDS:1 [Dentiscutata heterogama]